MNSHSLRLVAACLEANIVPLLLGEPGISKSASIEAGAKADGYLVTTFTGSSHEPADLSGPLSIRADGASHHAPPAWAVDMSAYCEAGTGNGRGLWLGDEFTSAPPAVQAAMLRPVQERWVGDTRLHDEIRIILIANPSDYAADGWEIEAPMANRVLHHTVTADPTAWAAGLVNGFDVTTPLSSRLSDNCRNPGEARIRVKRELVARYIRTNPAQAQQFPTKREDRAKPWPSLRSWTNVANLLPYLEEDDPILDEAISGLVGKAAGIQFVAWMHNNDVPTPEEILADPDCFDWYDNRIDRHQLVLQNLASFLDRRDRDRYEQQAWDVARAALTARRGEAATILIQKLSEWFTTPTDVANNVAGVLVAGGSLRRSTERG